MSCTRIVIAATGSGVGKTSTAIALIRSLRRRGLRVQTFKVGPDFLDPTHLALVSDRPCYNLDGWMCGKDYVLDLFQRKTADADIAVIEGVMGLFDGASPENAEGSTAEIVRWLKAPVLLVTGAHGVARSMAATVKGFTTFEPGLTVAGVIANHCGSNRQAAWLTASLASALLPPLLGAIPRGAFPDLPSRHLGLVTASHQSLSATILDAFAGALEQHVRIDEIIRQAARAPTLHLQAGIAPAAPKAANSTVTIGIARDAAFHFYYPDNLETLQSQGARLVFFSPLGDSTLPECLDAVYLGGGYPEEYAAELSRNTGLLDSLRGFVARGGVLYAECGGMIYLSQGIETRAGARFSLAGILPFWTRMHAKRKALGYVEVTLTADTLWGQRGDVLRGHEFHYSEIVKPTPAGWKTAYQIRYQRKTAPIQEGFQRGRVLASYAHLHFASHPGAARSFVEFVRKGWDDPMNIVSNSTSGKEVRS
ncbi:MAG: cobyrinate a,c-diamide synthase [Kiritimatiellae bacterium]|nr:cobyrinate a,c-diamide synthase [Verrucomicrobiota bacterium]MBU4285913.1 cobyrinate a,c-diamide synthase [Verrucomicrobiota bacterium]MBU4366255.1 cobyrinate a,c-diamide synthase [Verrucomicrobiota bacterium]MCG2660047.1 cobyrinate a,c-diamide synthase [Kiritimatiellia bacterium]